MQISKTPKTSEFEVQAKLFHGLREILGDRYLVKGEVTYNGCRFDLAIFDAETRVLICTLEVKGSIRKPGKRARVQRQLSRYRIATGTDCILVSAGNADAVLSALRARFSAGQR